MCIAAPGKVIEIQGRKATVLYLGDEIQQAMVANEKVKVGSFVLVQMGLIIDVVSKKEAGNMEKIWQKK